MSFFTVILILLCIYAPWVFPLVFVIGFFVVIFNFSQVLFWILIGSLVFCLIGAIIYSSKHP